MHGSLDLILAVSSDIQRSPIQICLIMTQLRLSKSL